jgi:hypothetical protein
VDKAPPVPTKRPAPIAPPSEPINLDVHK